MAAGLLFCGVSFFCMDKNREWEKNKKDATIHFKCCIFAHITYIGGFFHYFRED
jgi:hypothetical protein